MWVFDGEDWTYEGGSPRKPAPETETPEEVEEFYPELQIVEVPVHREQPIPPFPIPH
jgi:hypothetical protein